MELLRVPTAFCYGVFNSTTGLNLTEAPSRLMRTRTRGEDETELDAYVTV